MYGACKMFSLVRQLSFDEKVRSAIPGANEHTTLGRCHLLYNLTPHLFTYNQWKLEIYI